MKKHFKFLCWTIIPCLFLIGCGGDDEEGGGYTFENQDLQGSINGKSYVFGSGKITEDPFGDGENIVSLSDVILEDCRTNDFGELLVSFTLPTDNPVGLYEVDFSSSNPFSITMVDVNAQTFIVAIAGAVEILTSDENGITGRVVAIADGESTVNGNFSIPVCVGYEFLDQPLAGMINGKAWTFVDGFSEEDFFDPSQTTYTMMSEDLTNPCTDFPSGLRAFFSTPAAIGLYELQWDFDNPDNSFSVTLFDPDETLNIIATAGAVEILIMNGVEITGRMNVYFDEDSNINGNFTVLYCGD